MAITINTSFTKLTAIKIVELVLACCIIGLNWHAIEVWNLRLLFFEIITNGGYIIIFGVLLAARLTGTPVNRHVELYFSVIGCVLYLISGSLIINSFNSKYPISDYRDIGLSRGSLAIIESIVLLVDSYFTYKEEA